jgi:hypothetical protein
MEKIAGNMYIAAAIMAIFLLAIILYNNVFGYSIAVTNFHLDNLYSYSIAVLSFACLTVLMYFAIQRLLLIFLSLVVVVVVVVVVVTLFLFFIYTGRSFKLLVDQVLI